MAGLRLQDIYIYIYIYIYESQLQVWGQDCLFVFKVEVDDLEFLALRQRMAESAGASSSQESLVGLNGMLLLMI